MDREGLPLVPVSINVSPQQFARGRFQDTVESVTREHGIDPSLLWLEITENAVMHDIEQHLGSLHALRRLGAKIAVDDFGTGYSSLSYLKHLPIDALKVDRSFVRDMATDPNDAAIVTAIVRMARSLGCAPSPKAWRRSSSSNSCAQLGCDSAQGYYFGRPMAASRYPRHSRAPDGGACARRYGAKARTAHGRWQLGSSRRPGGRYRSHGFG